MKKLDEVFGLFSNERRRFVLYYLDRVDGKVSVDELAEQVYEWEANPRDDDAPEGGYDEMVISLEHKHLPKIEDATHVEYDRENDQVRITDLSTEVDVLLSVSEAIEQPANSEDIVYSGLL